MRKTFFILACILISTWTSLAQETSDYDKTLKKMFEVSGSEDAYKTVITQWFIMFKEKYTTVEPEIWNDLENEFMKTSINDLVAMLSPVYSKYMSQDDIEGLITFYETPLGKKFATNTPLIMQESMQVGQEWGLKVSQEFQQKMKEKGY